jgi:hypothetical protein
MGIPIISPSPDPFPERQTLMSMLVPLHALPYAPGNDITIKSTGHLAMQKAQLLQ